MDDNDIIYFMRNEIEYKEMIAKNLILYRRSQGLTQLQLAEKLNYSDKAVSKWERGESLPDLYVLQCLADLYGITLNDLTAKDIKQRQKKEHTQKSAIILLSVILTLLVATIAFVALIMIPKTHDYAWLAYIYSISACSIVTLVFMAVWKRKLGVFLSESILFFSVPLAVCCTINFEYNSWAIFFISVALEILAIAWYFRKKPIIKKKSKEENA